MTREELQALPIEQLKAMAIGKARVVDQQAQKERERLKAMPVEELKRMAFEKALKIDKQEAAKQEGAGLRQAQAGLESFGQGASFGYLPQLQAAAEPLTDAIGRGVESVGSFFTGEPTGPEVDEQLRAQGIDVQDKEQSYLQRRDQNLERQEEQREEFPLTTGAAEIAGGITSSIALGGLAGASGAGKGVQVLTRAQKLKKAATVGALYGAFQNPKDEKGKLAPLQVVDRFENALTGAATGAAFEGLVQGASMARKFFKKAPKNLEKMAYDQAVSAAGGERGSIKKVLKQNRLDLRKAGKDLLDNKIVEAGDDIFSIEKKLIKIRKSTGSKIGDITSQTDDYIRNVKTKNLTRAQSQAIKDSEIDMGKFAQKMETHLNKKLIGAGSTESKSAIRTMLNELKQEGDGISLGKLRELRQTVDDKISWSKSNLELGMTQKAYKEIRDELQDMTKKRIMVADKIGGTRNLALFNKSNRDYAQYRVLEDFAKNKVSGVKGNRALGLSEQIAGAAGFGTGGIAGFMLGVAASRSVKKWGGAAGARAVKRTGELLAKDPTKLGSFSTMIANAYKKDPEAALRMIIDLQQSSPEFKNILKGSKK